MRILAEDLAGDLTDMMDQQTENGSTKPDPLEDPLRRLNQPLDDMFSAGVREWVRKHREYRSMETDFPSPDHPDPRNGLAGLAMSGGGMRSAVFNLGVAQALAEYGVMNHVDYISTISGGGYLGSSLTCLCAEELPYPMKQLTPIIGRYTVSLNIINGCGRHGWANRASSIGYGVAYLTSFWA